jgi:hypothetical protein
MTNHAQSPKSVQENKMILVLFLTKNSVRQSFLFQGENANKKAQEKFHTICAVYSREWHQLNKTDKEIFTEEGYYEFGENAVLINHPTEELS